MGQFRKFGQDKRGGVAVTFGLVLLPFVGLVGGALDYSRASAEHTKLQRAADATALALVKQARSASKGQLEASALKVFNTLYAPRADVALSDPVVERVGSSIVVSRQGRLTNGFMQVLGFRDTGLRAESRAAWSNERIELALVLDNTGSMRELIGSKRKIDELKTAATSLVKRLHDIATEKDDVRLSIVPFDTEVRVDPAKHRYGHWQRWTDPNDAAERAAWTGYIYDRHQPHDVRDTVPAMALPDTLYPKLQTSQWATSGALAYVQPLVSLHDTTSFEAAKATIASMQPRGNTNVGLGVAWGVATLTGSVPLGATSADGRKVKRYMVVLTDGTNTQNRVNGAIRTASGRPSDPATRAINDRTAKACEMAKDGKEGGGAEVFTIRLLDGDVDLLKACASPPNARNPQHYFDVQSAAGLAAAFDGIVDAILGTRLTH